MFSKSRIPLVELSVKDSDTTKIEALEGCQFRLQARESQLPVCKLFFKPGQFLSLSSEFFFFGR